MHKSLNQSLAFAAAVVSLDTPGEQTAAVFSHALGHALVKVTELATFQSQADWALPSLNTKEGVSLVQSISAPHPRRNTRTARQRER
mmetsp:Transcript_43615/g.108874  ORF Transcript_43615/g.108874 Transcript_43615/m.108874 type:complete len:87 (-) Transcript_43615:115-375(-)